MSAPTVVPPTVTPAPPRRPWWRRLLRWLVVGTLTLLALGGIAVGVAFAVIDVPPPNDAALAQTTVVYWADGRSEIGKIGTADRRVVPLSDIPLDMQHATLAAEDRQFYEHGGFSLRGIARAAWNNVRGGDTQGASTITQQLVRNYYLTLDRTWSRKIKELVISVKLEHRQSKDQILQDYLNTIYFGRGAYGVDAAARAYFRVPASRLTLPQSVALASTIRSPGFYGDPANATSLAERMSYTADGMVQQGWLPADQEAAAATPPKPAPERPAFTLAGPNGYLVEAVRQELLARGFTKDQLLAGGLRVVTTFDRARQAAAITAVNDERPTTGPAGVRVGLASVDPATGAVVAMYGGRDYGRQQLNDATQSIAPAGSTFKPFALAAALEDGVSLSSRWDGSSPRTFDTPNGRYTVPNFGGESFGRITLLKATESSVNTVYVDVGLTVGDDRVVDAARRAGVPDQNSNGLLRGVQIDGGPTVVLGVASPTALDMASAYATFAAQGRYVPPTTLREVRSANAGVLLRLDPRPQTRFQPDVMADLSYALQNVVTNGSGFAAQALGRPSAGKTGTTDDGKSAWYCGFTPQLATAVVLFRPGPNGEQLSLSGIGGLQTVTGGSFPARIWTAYMRGAMEGVPVQDFPAPAFIGGQPTDTATSVPVSPTSTPTASPTGPTGSPTPSTPVSPTPPTTPPTQPPTTPPSPPPTTAPPPPTQPATVPPTTPPSPGQASPSPAA